MMNYINYLYFANTLSISYFYCDVSYTINILLRFLENIWLSFCIHYWEHKYLYNKYLLIIIM